LISFYNPVLIEKLLANHVSKVYRIFYQTWNSFENGLDIHTEKNFNYTFFIDSMLTF
jgi:serine acetyltransferase